MVGFDPLPAVELGSAVLGDFFMSESRSGCVSDGCFRNCAWDACGVPVAESISSTICSKLSIEDASVI